MKASEAPELAAKAASIDPREVALFGGIAGEWWDPKGSSKLLHAINPVRLGYIRARALDHFGRDPTARSPFAELRALDVGCGGGLLCEPLARMGFATTGLDAAPENVAVATAHAAAMGVDVSYRSGSAEALAAELPGSFDLVTCLEVVEHVADLGAFLSALSALLAPGGLLVFSTPNRTPQSYAVLIVGAERVLKSIPEGAHDWNKFLTPEELTAALAKAGLKVRETTGLGYALGRGFAIGGDMSINYIGTATAA
ncbi:bifunctional 2-polyprenyl-6-hydroxyphenol methylase/3-demethylubiquinol 3-O-methyltransferase UbiG [Sphingoaurantiacus capsulatus]|uniref:Ubiquinone biosynthesis O-methyltransferase n=1 Tax=Sphingoaurantiacus capsulatus TaxID=1771310 RepID=A0ABV7XB05_9SPHN